MHGTQRIFSLSYVNSNSFTSYYPSFSSPTTAVNAELSLCHHHPRNLVNCTFNSEKKRTLPPSTSLSLRASFPVADAWFIIHRLRVPLPPPSSPLSTLKDTLYNITGVSPQHMKLIHNGAILRDDLASLLKYGLIDSNVVNGEGELRSKEKKEKESQQQPEASKSFWDSWSFSSSSKKASSSGIVRITMIGNTKEANEAMWARRKIPVEEETKVEEKAPETETEVTERIRVLLGLYKSEAESSTSKEGKMEELERNVAALEQRVRSPPPPPSTSTAEPATEESSSSIPAPKLIAPNLVAAQLSESLIQTLLALDSISIDSTFAEARKERKEGVRRVQELLDRVDAVKDGLRKARA